MAVLSKPLLAQCHTCKKPIYWVVTENGKKMPVDHPATPDGNIIFVNRLAHVLHKGEVPPEGAKRWTSHYATCPQAEQHRKKTAVKKEPMLTVHLNMEAIPSFNPKLIMFGVDGEMAVDLGLSVTLHCGEVTKQGVVTEIGASDEPGVKLVTVTF